MRMEEEDAVVANISPPPPPLPPLRFPRGLLWGSMNDASPVARWKENAVTGVKAKPSAPLPTCCVPDLLEWVSAMKRYHRCRRLPLDALLLFPLLLPPSPLGAWDPRIDGTWPRGPIVSLAPHNAKGDVKPILKKGKNKKKKDFSSSASHAVRPTPRRGPKREGWPLQKRSAKTRRKSVLSSSPVVHRFPPYEHGRRAHRVRHRRVSKRLYSHWIAAPMHDRPLLLFLEVLLVPMKVPHDDRPPLLPSSHRQSPPRGRSPASARSLESPFVAVALYAIVQTPPEW